MGLLMCFNQRGTGVPCPPFLASMAISCIFLLVTTPTSAIISCGVFNFLGLLCVGRLGGAEGGDLFGGVWYLVRLPEEVQPCAVFSLGPM